MSTVESINAGPGNPGAGFARVQDSPTGRLWLGIDTGGTFTDAVLLADGRRVVASAKALTTPWDLAIGIGNAISAVLDGPAGARSEERRVGKGNISRLCR